jgi:DNA uptake protein ComE-like DNA-binding protein
VLGTAAAVGTSALIAGRNALGAARNRVEWTRAHWLALGCARRMQGMIDSALRAPGGESGAVWRQLRAEFSALAPSPCVVTLEAAGAKLDVNTASVDALARLFDATGRLDATRLAAEIAASRESAPFADLGELHRALPTVGWSDVDSLVSVEPGRIAIGAAPVAVLRSIPGFTPELATAVVNDRDAHGPLADLSELFTLTSHASAEQLEEHFQEVLQVAAVDPDAWILRASAMSGMPAMPAFVDWRLVRQGDGVAIVWSRTR